MGKCATFLTILSLFHRRCFKKQKKKQEDETKPDENVTGSKEKKTEQVVDQKVPENELKENQEIAKKLEKKKDK